MIEYCAGGIPMPTVMPISGGAGYIDMSSFGVPQQPQMQSPGMMPKGGMQHMMPNM